MKLTTCLPFALGVSLFVAAALPCSPARAADPEPISPKDKVIRPLAGKNFEGLYTWLKESGREDPKKVFTIEDGVLHISGEGAGYVATEQAYRDYHLSVEYKWGKK